MIKWLNKKWWRFLNRRGLISAKESRDQFHQYIAYNDHLVVSGVVRPNRVMKLITHDQSQIETWGRTDDGKWEKIKS